MKIRDKVRFAWKNIQNNKARAIITASIVYFIGLLIMGILYVAISFSDNMNRVFVETAKADNVEIYHMVDKEINLETLLELSEKYKDLGVNLSVSRHGFHLFDFRHFREKELKIVQGELPHNYVGKNHVYLPEELSEEYEINDLFPDYLGDFPVAGFYSSEMYFCPLLDLSYYGENISGIDHFSFRYFYDEGRNINKDLITLNKLFGEVKTLFGSDSSRTFSDALANINLAKTVSVIVIASFAFLAAVLILLSVGSINNSIMLSIDQNKKFIGLMKTLGLKSKNLKDIIIIETFFTVIFGILAASISLIFLIVPIKELVIYLLEFFLRHEFIFVSETFKFHVFFPYYLPPITVFAVTFFSVFFSRAGIRGIIKANPVAIINEVN